MKKQNNSSRPSLLERILTKLKLYINGVWAIPLILLIRRVKSFCLVRFCIIDSTRIGHFIPHSILYWTNLKEQPINTVDLFWFSEKVSNRQWAKMAKRKLWIHWSIYYLDYWNKKIPNGQEHILKATARDLYGKVKQNKEVPFEFLPEEDLLGREWLRAQGIKDNEKFVCLLVRDNAFLQNTTVLEKRNYDYHNYRDTDIADYVQAVEWLADRGVWVLRMGSIMHNPIPIKHPKVIDYSFHADKSEFMDIWLFAHCDLCISTGAGLDYLADYYMKPMLFVNLIPFPNIWSWCDSINLPKHLIWKSTGKYLSLREHIANNFDRTENYENARIIVKDLSPEEILNVTKECWEKIEDTWIYTQEEKELQAKFWTILKEWPDYSKKHHWIHPKCQIGYSWLKSNEYDFFA